MTTFRLHENQSRRSNRVNTSDQRDSKPLWIYDSSTISQAVQNEHDRALARKENIDAGCVENTNRTFFCDFHTFSPKLLI